MNEDLDSGIRGMYDVYEADYMFKLELNNPEGYAALVKALAEETDGEVNTRAFLYVGEIGVYNRTIDEDSFANYMDEIVVGLAVTGALLLTLGTLGMAAPAIVGAVGLGALLGPGGVAIGVGGAIALGVAGVTYGAVVGLGVGVVMANVGYYVNTSYGSDGYALDGTYLTEETKAEMYNRYMVNAVKAGVLSGMAAGASAAWMVETAWDAGEFLLAAFRGDKVGMAVSAASLLFSTDDAVKGVRKVDDVVKSGDEVLSLSDELFDTLDDLPEGWKRHDNNGRTHIKDPDGNTRLRIDPPDKNTPFDHVHIYDESGTPLDINGNIVPRNSPDAHIPLDKIQK